MENTVIVYQSKHGHTKRYALALAKELACLCLAHDQVSMNDLEKYQNIIYGGCVYAGMIKGISLIKKNIDKFKDKNLIVFTVGIRNPNNTKEMDDLIHNNFKGINIDSIKFFHIQGGMIYKQLSMPDKMIMSMVVKASKGKKLEDLTEDEKTLIKGYKDQVDFTDLSSIDVISTYVKEL